MHSKIFVFPWILPAYQSYQTLQLEFQLLVYYFTGGLLTDLDVLQWGFSFKAETEVKVNRKIINLCLALNSSNVRRLCQIISLVLVGFGVFLQYLISW